jgi:hypothetical protein
MSQSEWAMAEDVSKPLANAIGQSPTGGVPPPAAAPPTRSEIERKLSFKSAARPTTAPVPSNESPKKNKVC